MLGSLDRGVVRELIDKIGTAIFVVDVLEDGGFRMAAINGRVEQITGLDNDEIAGKPPEEIFDAVGAARAQKYWQRCVEARETIEFENWQDFAAGRVWAVTTLVPVLEQDKVLRLVGTAIEITAWRPKRFQNPVPARECGFNSHLRHDLVLQGPGPPRPIGRRSAQWTCPLKCPPSLRGDLARSRLLG